jgi:DNA-binding winged helix-turn-helix (wHTH) protein/Flp pilus assembly protein TadD
MDNSKPIFYEFGPFRLDTLRRLLLQAGEIVPLTPKAFDVLLLLIQNTGQLLSKEYLLRSVWPDAIVEEGNLSQYISVLRKVLGENPNEHRYIVTVPGRGYRFVAQVTESRESNAAPQYQFISPPEKSGSPSGPPTIAVLPFKLMNPTSEEAYLGQGIASSLIASLSGIKQIIVRPTTSVLKYASAEQSPLAAGLELEVDSILDGTVQQVGERIRVMVELIRTADGSTLWTNKYDKEFTDIFAVQDAIAQQVARALKLKLSSQEERRLNTSLTENLEAYRLYIKGRYFWEKRTEKNIIKGIEYGRQIIGLDGNFAMGHVFLADCYTLLGQFLYLHPQRAFPRAKSSALRALAIDDTLAEAHCSLAEVLFFYEWDWVGAEREYRHAIELNPHYASAHHWYAWFLIAMGQFEEAVRETKMALKLDPSSLILHTTLGLPYYYMRQYERAMELYRETLEMDEKFAPAHYYLGAALLQTGQYEEAAAELKKVKSVEYVQQASALLGYAYAVGGKKKEALHLIEELNDLAKHRYVSPYSAALIYTGLGDKDHALAALNKAYDDRAAWMIFLKVDPHFESLRAHRGFKHLLHKMDLDR